MRADCEMDICSSFWKCLFSTSRMARAKPHKKKRVVISTKGRRYLRSVSDACFLFIIWWYGETFMVRLDCYLVALRVCFRAYRCLACCLFAIFARACARWMRTTRYSLRYLSTSLHNTSAYFCFFKKPTAFNVRMPKSPLMHCIIAFTRLYKAFSGIPHFSFSTRRND